jgi:hypothetical protein
MIQTTAIALLSWLSTMHNMIDLVNKAFPISESRTQATRRHNLILQIEIKYIKLNGSSY